MIEVRPSKCYRTHSSGSSVKTIISAPPKWPDPNLPALKKLLGPGPMVVPKLLDNVRRALALFRQLEVGPAALDLELVVLAVGVRAPLALGVDVGDVASAGVVLIVHCEVHHKAHLVRKIESEAVAGPSRKVICNIGSSCLHSGLLVDGRLVAVGVPGVGLVKLPRPVVPLEAGEP